MNLEQEVRPPVKYTPENKDFVRMRYYSKLKDNYQKLDESFAQAPTHVINEDLYQDEFDLAGYNVDHKKHGSFTIIFTVWNNLLGASLITIPWAFSNAGLIVGTLIVFLSFLISYYTTWLIIKLTRDDEEDFTDTLQRYFGKYGSYSGMISSVLVLSVPILYFFQIICQMLFPVIILLTGLNETYPKTINLQPQFNQFSYSYTCVILLGILFLLSMKKDLKVFIRISSVGVVFTLMIILFIFSTGIKSLQTVQFTIVNTYESIENKQADAKYLQLYSLQFAPLMGMMSGGFYLHNLSIPILKHAKNKENNMRDVFIGYLLAFISYLGAGILGYIGFIGISDPGVNEIAQNCLNMFTPENPYAFIVRVSVAFLLLSLYPLLLTIMKQQIWILYQKLKTQKIKFRIPQNHAQKPITDSVQILMSIIILVTVALVGIFYPKAGSLMAILSSIFCFFIIYTIPTMAHIQDILQNSKSEEIPLIIGDKERDITEILIDNQLDKSTVSQSNDTSLTPSKFQEKSERKASKFKRKLFASFQGGIGAKSIQNESTSDNLQLGPVINQDEQNSVLLKPQQIDSFKEKDGSFIINDNLQSHSTRYKNGKLSLSNIVIIVFDVLVIIYGLAVLVLQYVTF